MSEKTNEMTSALGHLKKGGILKVVILGFAVGIILLLIGGFAFGDEEKNDVSEPEHSSKESYVSYKLALEEEIEKLCSTVKGVKSTTAAVFFSDIGGSLYAQNTQSGGVEKNEYVIIGSGSSSRPLYIGESLPEISGIGVVCNTSDDEHIRNEVSVLLAATYGLPLTRIYVSEGK